MRLFFPPDWTIGKCSEWIKQQGLYVCYQSISEGSWVVNFGDCPHCAALAKMNE